MKTLLIFPPYLRDNWLHYAVPLLNGQLSAVGIDAYGLDLNCEFFDYILTPDFMSDSLVKMENLYEIINEKILRAKDDKLLQQQFLINKHFMDFILKKQKNNVLDFISNVSKLKKYIYSNKPLEDKHYKSAELGVDISMFPYKFYYGITYSDLKEKTFDKENNIYYKFFEQYIERLSKENYKFIGITVSFFEQLLPAFTLACMLKKYTKSKILLGGVFLSGITDEFIKHNDLFDIFCDYILTGEGEHSIVEFARYLENKTSEENVAGLIYRNKDGQIIQNKKEIIKNINEIKDLSLKGYEINKYIRKNIPIEFSKGCYWGKCVFCYSSHSHHCYNYNPVEAVDKLERISKKYNIKSFDIIDDALSPAFIKQFAQELIKRKSDINYGAFLRFEEAYDTDFFKLLKTSGLRTAFWGYESASERILKLMNKANKIVDREKILDSALEAGIANKIGFIIGFPSETLNEAEETIKVYNKYKDICGTSLNIFTLYNYSSILEDKEKYEITYQKPIGELTSISLFKSSGITGEDIVNLLNKYNINCPQQSMLGSF